MQRHYNGDCETSGDESPAGWRKRCLAACGRDSNSKHELAPRPLLFFATNHTQTREEAIRVPSTSALSLAQATSGWTSSPARADANPQSVPAMTRSRPTTLANFSILSATTSGARPDRRNVTRHPGSGSCRPAACLLPYPPLMFMARISGFYRICLSAHLEH